MKKKLLGGDAWVTIALAGPFPPPLHGMSWVNKAVCTSLRASGAVPLVLNSAPKSLSRALSARLTRVPALVRAWLLLAFSRGLARRALYISVSGGVGKVFEVIFIGIARARGMRIYLHHHTFAYLGRRSTLAAWLIRAAGVQATHIALSDGMGGLLKSLYGARRVEVISNTAFVGTESGAKHRRDVPRTIGYLSNISSEKGIFDFLDVVGRVSETNIILRAKVAGPFQDSAIEQQVMLRISELRNVEYVGPRYGMEKDDFLSSIDVLLFPTRYANEAEPLTVHEAMSHGVPVIAYGRGCIPEILSNECGRVITPDDDFVEVAVRQLARWRSEPAGFRAACANAHQRFRSCRLGSIEQWARLRSEMLSQGAGVR